MSNLRFQVVEEAFKKRPVDIRLPKERPSAYFGKYVFNREKMYRYLPKDVYTKLIDVIDNGARLDRSIADAVAAGMKQWAQEMGVTHYTHWFQPLTEGTAEKHDAFVEHDGKGGMVEDFTGKLLVQQEPDASSFPNGGIRNTFEARGYSAWDPTSPVFIIDDTLCIPTIFIAYTGEALDYKAPLLRSIHALDKAATDVCRTLGMGEVRKVRVNLGWEQEYFLVDEGLYSARPDLMLTGRTLLGHESAKNQQMDDHYFGIIPDRVQAFMKDLEVQALELAIPCKTRHNEVAPNQFELAPIFEECNLAVDHNMLLMSLMKRVARKHGFRVLLHEKPFDGINGSGKHNNWSLSTDSGVLLHAPGKTPEENLRFVVFIVETLMAVHRHNLDHIEESETNELFTLKGKQGMEIDIPQIPDLIVDNTDRNRTSPFAFTGNKFEFRMVGSSDSIACANVMINASVAESLRQFADVLEQAENFDESLHALIREEIIAHKRILFNGNGYDDAWIREATEERGLLNLRTTPDALSRLLDEKNVAMLTRHGVFSESELRSRYEIQLENYIRTVHIEALTMLDMAKREILPAVASFSAAVADGIAKKKAAVPSLACSGEAALVEKLTALIDGAEAALGKLSAAVEALDAMADDTAAAFHVKDTVIPAMAALRAVCDEAETLTAADFWPFPTYGDLLFGV